MEGCRSRTTLTLSKSDATCRMVDSASQLPTNWTLMGMPSWLVPNRIEMPGKPVRLPSQPEVGPSTTKGFAKLRTSSTPFPMQRKRSTGAFPQGTVFSARLAARTQPSLTGFNRPQPLCGSRVGGQDAKLRPCPDLCRHDLQLGRVNASPVLLQTVRAGSNPDR